MVRTTICLLVACLAWLSSAVAPLGAQANERVAYVTVVDKASGEPLSELRPTDVIVREDGVAREVLRVTPATGPFPIAVLVDTSSEAEPAIPDIRNALTAFVDALGTTGPVSLIGFGDRPTVLTDYTAAPAAFRTAIGRVFAQPSSGATVVEAIHETAGGLRRRDSERAAIVLLSVSGPEMSTLHFTPALQRLTASGASLHAVTLTRPGRTLFTDAVRQRDTLLDRGVRQTGGFRRDVIASQSFPQAMGDLGRILARQFRVVYARPQTLIPPRSLQVLAASPDAVAYGGAAREPRK